MTQPTRTVLFSSPTSAVLATAGVAIGLGNIWRFPYMMGQYGGGMFLLLYVLIVIAFGIPGLMVECALGKLTRRGPDGAFQACAMPGARWWSGLLLITVLLGASYYGVVLAWVLQCAAAFVGAAAGLNNEVGSFAQISGGRGRQLLAVILTVLMACSVILFGVRRGIERFSRIGLPIFFLLFLFLIARVLTLPGAMTQLRAFLTPHPEQLTYATGLAAMGQAFFSLGLGGTFMVMYGSYLGERDSIPRVAVGTTIADLAAALMAGFLIVPAVLVYGLDMTGGPTLMFEVMPTVFGQMPAGMICGSAFFFAVFLVGLLSLVAAYEVLAVAAERRWGWSRRRIGVVIFAGEIVLAVPALLVPDYIKYSDLIWGTTMQPLGSGLAVIALCWCIGRTRALEMMMGSSPPSWAGFLFIWMKFVLPVGIVAMLIAGWLA